MQDILFVAKVEEIKKRVCEAVIGLITLLIIIRVKFRNHPQI